MRTNVHFMCTVVHSVNRSDTNPGSPLAGPSPAEECRDIHAEGAIMSAPAIVIDPGGTLDGDSVLDGLLTLAEEARLRGDYRAGVAHARRAVERADCLGE